MLSNQGYEVIEAMNGEDALRLARDYSREFNGSIDLLLTDVVMPLMGGKELAQRVAELYPDCSILYTSGYTDKANLNGDVAQPNRDFLQKPFQKSDLLTGVREVLDDGSME